MPELIRVKAHEIRNALAELGRRLDAGEDSELLVWVIPDKLACAHRPLRHHPLFGGSRRDLPPEAAPAIFEWVKRMHSAGIRAIISLMHPKEVRHYAKLDLGADDLIDFYRKQGFEVEHLPWDDPAHRQPEGRAKFGDELVRIRDEALSAYDALPEPVVLHCSAGIDRSSPVAAHIFWERSPGRDDV